VVLGWSRAILMQLAHPLIAAAVIDHSAFRDGPRVAALRLRQTIRAMLSLTFGDEPTRARTLAHINGIHRRVNGHLREATGPFPTGTAYSAEDPALITWVHVTLMQSVPLTYAALVGSVSDDEWDRYCLEAAPIARALGATGSVPTSRRAIDDYVQRMIESGELAVGVDARTLSDAVLTPPFAPFVGPLARLNRLFTAGSLPPELREQYALPWNGEDDESYGRWTAAIRRFRRRMPDRMARWASARPVTA